MGKMGQVEQTQRKNPSGSRSNRVNIKEDTGVVGPVVGGQDQAAVAGAPMLLPVSRRLRHPGSSSPGGGGLVPVRLLAGGRPRGRIGPARPGSRPASPSARRSRNSIWALVLRSSSLAHRARAS
jgi:hypothetical protein